MPVIDRWLEYLNLMDVRYSHSTHPRAEKAIETASAERVVPHALAKTVVYFSETGFGIAVVPADQFIDLLKVGRLLGLAQIRLANETELMRLFPNCELGAMPPFGDYCDLPVIVDAGLASEFIAFTIGTHRDVIRISFADFQRLARPKVALIAMAQEILV